MGASHLGKALESACAVAAAVCMAVGLASSASADDTTADAARLPDHIVNGDFEYRHDWFREHAAYGWTAVIPLHRSELERPHEELSARSG